MDANRTLPAKRTRRAFQHHAVCFGLAASNSGDIAKAFTKVALALGGGSVQPLGLCRPRALLTSQVNPGSQYRRSKSD